MGSLTGFSDSFCKFFDVYYNNQLTVQGTPRIKMEITASITGSVAFQYKFYSDASFTQLTSETAFTSIVNGYNFLELNNPPQLYAIGRLSLIPGSTISITSLKINDAEHITAGNMVINSPAITFETSSLNQNYFASSKLGQITDPSFNVEFQVQNLLGTAYFQYLYYTDNTYSTLSYTTTIPVSNGTRYLAMTYTHLFVLIRFKLDLNSSIQVTSFKVKGVEQFATTMTFNSPLISSEICFPSGTLVKTDQGLVEIQKIDPQKHTLHHMRIIAVTETYSTDDSLVFIEKDSIRKNYPSRPLLVSKKHKIYVKGKMKAAYRYVDQYKGISLVPYIGQKLYNILLEEYALMNVHGMLCETLHPDNPVAKIFREVLQ